MLYLSRPSFSGALPLGGVRGSSCISKAYEGVHHRSRARGPPGKRIPIRRRVWDTVEDRLGETSHELQRLRHVKTEAGESWRLKNYKKTN